MPALWEKTLDETRITGAVTDPFGRDRNPAKTRINGTLISSHSPSRTAGSSMVPCHDTYHSSRSVTTFTIANLQKMAVAERRQAEPTTQHRNEVGLAVRQATIVLLAESCRQ